MTPAQTLALLGVKGATSEGGDPSLHNYLVRLDANGMLPTSALSGATVLYSTFYVDATNGSDTTGTGAINAPYQTLSKVQSILAATATAQAVIILAPGTYAPPAAFVATTSQFHFIGSNPDMCVISGTLSVAASSEVYVTGVALDILSDNDVAGSPQIYMMGRSTANSISSANVGATGVVTTHPGTSVTGVTNLSIVSTPDAAGLSYTPAVAGDWSPAPTKIDGGLDQLASRTKVIEDKALVESSSTPVTDNQILVWDGVSGTQVKEYALDADNLVNDGANLGTGYNVFKVRTGHSLTFRALSSLTDAIVLAYDGPSELVTIDIVASEIGIGALNGTLAVAKGGTGVTTFNTTGIVLSDGTNPLTIMKVNRAAIVDPTVTDDDSQGYVVGSRWYNLSTNDEFVCMSSATNAAIWVSTTVSNGEANTASNIGSDGADVYKQKSGVNLQLRKIYGVLPVQTAVNAGENRIDVTMDIAPLSSLGTPDIANDLLVVRQSSSGEFRKVAIDSLGAPRTGVYRTIYVNAGEFTPQTTNGATPGSEEYATNNVMSNYLAFADSGTQFAQVRRMLPLWDAADIKAKLVWTAGSAGATVLGVAALALGSDQAIDSAFGTERTIAQTLTAIDDVDITPATAAITPSGSVSDGVVPVVFRVARQPGDAGDTITGDVKLLGLIIQYREVLIDPTVW